LEAGFVKTFHVVLIYVISISAKVKNPSPGIIIETLPLIFQMREGLKAQESFNY
jgi:hypothetical protein